MVHIESLETENSNLKREIQKLKPIVDKMTLSSSKLELLLTSNRDSYDKTGIGYNSSNTCRISKPTSTSTSKSLQKGQEFKHNLANYRHVRTIITITEPHATTSNSLRKAFNDMAQTFKPTLKRATDTFLKLASLSRKVVFKENLIRKNKLSDQRGPKVAWVPKILP